MLWEGTAWGYNPTLARKQGWAAEWGPGWRRSEAGRSRQRSPRRGLPGGARRKQPRGWGRAAGKPTGPLTSRRKGREWPARCNIW